MSADIWKSGGKDSQKAREQISKRFTYYFARLRWRRALVKVTSQQRFLFLLQVVRQRAKEEAERFERENRQAQLQKRQQEEIADQARKENELEAKKKEEELRALEEVSLQKIEKHKTEVFSSDDYDSDVDDSETENPEKAKLNKYLKEIMQDANEATEVKVLELENEGHIVDQARRNRIQHEFEQEYTQRMARYDALLTQNRDLMKTTSDFLVNLKNNASKFVENFVSTQSKVRTDVGSMAEKWNRDMQTMVERWKESKYYNDALDRLSPYLNISKPGRKDSKLRFSKPVKPATLERGKSNIGEKFVKISKEERTNPVLSAEQQFQNIQNNLKNGLIDVHEAVQMIHEIADILHDKESKKQSDLQGVKPRFDPDAEGYHSMYLAQGVFYFKVRDVLQDSRAVKDSTMVSVLCAWKPQGQEYVENTWEIEDRVDSFVKMLKYLSKNKERLFKEDAVPEPPKLLQALARKKWYKKSGKSSENDFQKFRKQLDTWLQEVADGCINADNMVRSIFDDFFKLSAHTNYHAQ